MSSESVTGRSQRETSPESRVDDDGVADRLDFKSRAKSPPSSPPVRDTTLSPTRKRSHDDMITEADDAVETSSTAVGDVDLPGSTVEPSHSQTDLPVVASSNMLQPPPPPQRSSSSMPPPLQRLPRSGQSTNSAQPIQSPSSQTSKIEMASISITPPPANPDIDQGAVTNRQQTQESSMTLDAPDDKIVNFQWQDLEYRYHQKMDQLASDEHEILNEFNDLCKCFAIWADTNTRHEVDRSFKRLKTQVAFVQNQEEVLEQKRQHYLKVVQAFASALELLGP